MLELYRKVGSATLTMDMTPHVVYASAKIAADSGTYVVEYAVGAPRLK